MSVQAGNYAFQLQCRHTLGSPHTEVWVPDKKQTHTKIHRLIYMSNIFVQSHLKIQCNCQNVFVDPVWHLRASLKGSLYKIACSISVKSILYLQGDWFSNPIGLFHSCSDDPKVWLCCALGCIIKQVLIPHGYKRLGRIIYTTCQLCLCCVRALFCLCALFCNITIPLISVRLLSEWGATQHHWR